MFNIDALMIELSRQRPVFHSEADLQHAFAWQFQKSFPNAQVRLEYPIAPPKRMYLDIWLHVPNMQLAIELKYKTVSLEFQCDDEHFYLKHHSATDVGRYDFLKDVARLEYVMDTRQDVTGYAILLTNDSGYWNHGRKGTADADFRLSPSRSITGKLCWGGSAAKGTTKGREAPIELRGHYTVDWKPYVQLPTPNAGLFRYLAFKV